MLSKPHGVAFESVKKQSKGNAWAGAVTVATVEERQDKGG